MADELHPSLFEQAYRSATRLSYHPDRLAHLVGQQKGVERRIGKERVDELLVARREDVGLLK